MTIINHAFTSPIWMTSTLDNKKEIETKLNQANAAGYPVHLIDNEQEEKGKSLTWWPNNNDSAIFNNQSFDNQKINLSITINEFYNIAHDEQNRLLRLLLIKEGIINHDKKAIPAGELVNHVINYVARCKNDNSKISELARLLLKPLGQYGSGQNEQITATHCQTVIANWLQQAVFNTSADSWLLKKICDIKLQQHSLFHHDNLKQGVFNQLNSHIEVNQLSANVGDYYQQQVLSHIMPTLFLQPKNSYDQQRLQNMVINQPEWGYLHAGTALLSESGADFNSMSLDQIINIGMWLETMLLEQKLPVEYIQYFKLPALIHSVLKNNYQQITHEIDKAKMLSIYHIYFDHLTQHSKNNPFIQWVQRVNNWKSRPELARQQLIEHNVEQTWLNNYLYKNSDVKYHDRQGNAVVLPNIDKVFNNQNQQLADIFKQTELTLLPQVFNAFSEAEQQFIQQAQIYLVKAEFNAQGSVRSAPLPPPARLGMVASGALITRVPDSIDMLKCIFNGEERIYALQKQANTEIGRYQLYRVDYDKKAILDLFPHDHKIRDDDDYQLRLHVDSLLKQADEKPQVLLSSLSTLHRDRLAEKLQQEGYQPTIQQKVDTFFLHLIPFYTTITEARKGNTGQAVGAALFDVSGFFPFLVKAAHISNRFSIAVGEAAVNGLQTALKQATLRQALHQGAKQLLKSGIPHVANSLPANLFAELGTAFLRSADPGFELLASGGLKGIHALKKVAKQSQQQLSGLTQLVEALEKKANDFPVAHSERFKIETAYHPAQLKEVPVTKIGRQSGKDIYVQVYPETGQPFGRKYLRDTAGNLALAPVPIGERLYQLKIQGLGGKGAKMGAKKLAAQSNTVQLEQISLNELKELLLTQQENTIIDLSSKNLHNIDFSTLFAEKIDLTFVNFSDANLSGSNLSNLNLTNATLHKASLNGAILHRVNLNNANLISVDLYRAILNDAKLNNANLLRANLKETNLVNADLINADLTQATLSHTNLMHANLAHADLTQTDLSHANLQQVSIHGTNFSGAILDNTIDNFTLSLPSKWHEHNLEFELNHFNPQGRSILTSIDSIDDKYSQLKTKLALQVIHSLEHSTVNLTNVTPSLLDIFSKALFIKNPEINNFVDKLIENYLKKPSLQLINKLEAHPTMIPAFLNYFDRQPYLMELAKYNDAFIQTLIATRTQGADSIKITANSLYKKYLHLPYIQQQLQHAEIKRLFDDQAGNGDWTKKEAANYLLLSPTKAGRVLIVSEKELTQMLHPNLHTNWNNIALFQHGKRLSPTEYSLSQCYKQDFPLFSHLFPHNGSDALMKKRPISFKSGKIVQKETNGALYTRAAQYIEYNNELFRVKNPFYSNYVAAEEVIMGGIFSMTGLDAPRMLLCNDCDDFFIFNKKTRGDFQDGKNLSSFACVASQVEPSFKDLGDFLLDEKMMIEIIKKSAIEELLLDSYIKKSVVKYQSLREIFNKADCELTNILQKYPNKSYLAKPDVLAQIKNKNLIKFTMLEEMNKLLPQKLRDEQLKHFFVSRLLNNWDYLNFAFCNFGYFIDKRIHPTEFKGMTVDFGGSGTLGFGGLAKNESYQRAMQGARPENPLASTSLFTEKDANFSNNLPDSLTGISSVPRSRPLLSTIRGQVAVENNIFEAKDFNNFNKELMPALEVAYRLQVLPDHAIEDYLHENWLMGEKDFPYRDKDSKYNIDTAKIIAIIKDRKRSFIQYFGQDTIKHWEQNNILQAAKIRIEIADSLKRLMNKIYTIQPVSAASQTV